MEPELPHIRAWAAIKSWVDRTGWLYFLSFGVVFLFALYYYVGVVNGWSLGAGLFPIFPFLMAFAAVPFTVVYYGSPEQKRDAIASFLVYALLAVLTAFSLLIGEKAVTDKFVDALIFGQVVPLLSLAKVCLNSWWAPTPRETPAERTERLESARETRRRNKAIIEGKE